ncbi:FAD:protein FMN transferase [Ruminococcus gauvreauii]|uniref:FAD:protein FMN transferase n=1 Tax=Ruminococcus gauvreauii TaxID=438033 RepID=UPI003983E542
MQKLILKNARTAAHARKSARATVSSVNFKTIIKTGVLAALLLVPGFLISGCGSKQPEMVSRQGFYFDTVIGIEAYGNPDDVRDAVEHAFALCQDMEKTFSRTRSDSELYALNHRTEQSVEVSDELADVISAGLSYYELSEGRFDITIAPVSELWDFKSENPRVPDADAIAEAVKKVDARKVHVQGNTVTFDSPDTMIDLGAIVKGYAADRLKEHMEEDGITSGMINLGGNVMTIGRKQDGTDWSVGIQKPFAERNETIATLRAPDCSVVSSGVYERYFETDGIRYSHILDASTGYPADTDLWQATVVTDSSMQGDALSTVCMLLGYEKARQLTDQLDGVQQVLFVGDDGSLLEP